MGDNMNIKLLLLFFLVLGFFACQVSSASTYYVAKTGDDGNVGSEASPWLTIQKAANTSVAGDIIYVKNGTYIEWIRFPNSGSAGNYITFQNYSTDIVTVKAPNQFFQDAAPGVEGAHEDLGHIGNSLTHWHGNIEIINKSYIKIKGFKVTSNSDIWTGGWDGTRNEDNRPPYVFSVERSSHHIIIDGNVLDDIDASAISAGFYNITDNGGYNAWNIDFINNYIDHKWFNSSSYEVISFDAVNYANVSNNYIANHSKGECIDLKDGTSNSIISYNYVSNCQRMGDAWWEDVAPEWYASKWTNGYQQGIYVDSSYENLLGLESNNISIFGNTLYRTQGIDVGSEEGNLVKDINIYNNIIIESFSCVYLPPNSTDKAYGKNISVYNNVCVNVHNTTRGYYTNGIPYFVTDNLYTNITFQNNILYDSPSFSDYPYNEPSSNFKRYNNSWDLNIVQPQFTSPPIGETVTTGNNRTTNTNSRRSVNLHLNSTSPARMVGNSTGRLSSTDIDGVSWETPMSIGAYEYTPNLTISVPAWNVPGFNLWGGDIDLRENGVKNGSMYPTHLMIPIIKPSSPVSGSIYINQTTHALNWFDDGLWYCVNITLV